MPRMLLCSLAVLTPDLGIALPIRDHLRVGHLALELREAPLDLIDEVLDETFGFGPLEILLKDPTISDILINGPHKIYVERRGKLEKTDVKFRESGSVARVAS